MKLREALPNAQAFRISDLNTVINTSPITPTGIGFAFQFREDTEGLQLLMDEEIDNTEYSATHGGWVLNDWVFKLKLHDAIPDTVSEVDKVLNGHGKLWALIQVNNNNYSVPNEYCYTNDKGGFDLHKITVTGDELRDGVIIDNGSTVLSQGDMEITLFPYDHGQKPCGCDEVDECDCFDGYGRIEPFSISLMTASKLLSKPSKTPIEESIGAVIDYIDGQITASSNELSAIEAVGLGKSYAIKHLTHLDNTRALLKELLS